MGRFAIFDHVNLRLYQFTVIFHISTCNGGFKYALEIHNDDNCGDRLCYIEMIMAVQIFYN